MDCFYAAVEMRDNPKLANIPLAIGGSPNGRGVLCTCNYVARKFGVRSAMPSFMALKRCPELVFIKPNFSKYKEASDQIRDIFREYTDIIEPLSLDEAYLDITNSSKFHGSGTLIAEKIITDIKNKLDLPASAGVSYNKFLAKIASDWNKPNGLFTIEPHFATEFLKDLPVNKINGVGKITYERLKEDNIYTCSDIFKIPKQLFIKKYGKTGEILYDRARGIDLNPVTVNFKRKSLSVENTFPYNRGVDETSDLARQVLGTFLERLYRNIEIGKFCLEDIKKVFVKIKLTNFCSRTKEELISTNLIQSISDHQKFYKKDEWSEHGEFLLERYTHLLKTLLSPNDKIRLMGLGIRLREESTQKGGQLELFSPKNH